MGDENFSTDNLRVYADGDVVKLSFNSGEFVAELDANAATMLVALLCGAINKAREAQAPLDGGLS